jgi:cyclopropane fatty-acyl-phospholipid synthase-like methyltransferase
MQQGAAMEPLTDVRDISRIAYGYMGSMSLFTALELDLFSRLAERPSTVTELAQASGIAANRLQSLVAALCSVGLISCEGDRYANAPAAARYLVRGAPGDYGEYLRVVNGRMVYPLLLSLHSAMRGERNAGDSAYFGLYATDDDAQAFTAAQHAGSLGPASVLAKRVDLAGCRRLLDVGGGSGAFTIRFCQRNPELQATILDFPGTVSTAQAYAAEAGLSDRVTHIAGNALSTDWPGGQDVVLMSYLWSAVGDGDARELARRAHAALNAGGRVLVHDFMVDEAYAGPPIAAWHLLVAVVENPHAVCLTRSAVQQRLHEAGFRTGDAAELLPGITSLVAARKP